MSKNRIVTVDGNEAAASVAHRLSEVVAIYPITPSSPMGEFSDEWAAQNTPNIWGTVPQVTEMQSEGGAAGAVHGALQAGALTTTFTASQGLLLMIPNMYKIAGELTSFAMHVSARTLATHALSIFGDHSDVMACRQTGFAMLASNSVQEAHDLAAIAHAATLKARVPFLHFFDGFRTSHEVTKIEELNNAQLKKLVPERLVNAHRERALSPDRPKLRGTAQNPDTFFQAREACNPFYNDCPDIVADTMAQFAKITGREYKPFDYVGHPEAQRLIVLMGSGAEVAHEAVEHLAAKGQKVGMIKVRMYRPFSMKYFLDVMPETVESIAVLDRTKEPGGVGEPLYLDLVAGLCETYVQRELTVVGGRYGLSSKDFTPAQVKAVFDELKKNTPKNHFTVGIVDDVTHTSITVDENFDIEPANVVRAIFWGLGADGTVGANKNSIKIIGEETDNYAQGYFVYDSKKSGSVTVSHLRFGPEHIRSSYLIHKANFIACHQSNFLDRYDVLEAAAPGAVFLLNTVHSPEQVWDELPREVQTQIIDKNLKVYVIDAFDVAARNGMGVRINTIMQTCFFAVSGVLPRAEAIAKIKDAIQKTYGRKGDDVVQKNFRAVEDTLEHLAEMMVPGKVTSKRKLQALISKDAPKFVREVSGAMLGLRGDGLPVSALPVDGTYPTGTTKYEKRGIALEIPVWDEALCIQCGKCAFACPHAAIRIKVYEPKNAAGAPATLKSAAAKGAAYKGLKFTLQVAPEDCTGCSLCATLCPAAAKTDKSVKALMMSPQAQLVDQERENWNFFLTIPYPDRAELKIDVKGSQFLEPLFEFSGCCAGCGETAYVKLLTQMFGDRALIANATGCSSIYGGNLPTTPYTVNDEGRGPTWSNSLFEDNAEFGFGMRLALDKNAEHARELLSALASELPKKLVKDILNADQTEEAEVFAQRKRVEKLRDKLSAIRSEKARRLINLSEHLVKRSVWILGGDGWAYDIGYGGLDHVLSMGRNVNILVMDTEVYSNTGGQMSKATPTGAIAKFAAAGKEMAKKDLGFIAMTYQDVYVAKIAYGASELQTIKAFREAESYPGTSLIIAYSPCIAHGYDLAKGPAHQKMAVDSGHWPMYRFDPRLAEAGQNPYQMDSKAPKIDLSEYAYSETRYKSLAQLDEGRSKALLEDAQEQVTKRNTLHQRFAELFAPLK